MSVAVEKQGDQFGRTFSGERNECFGPIRIFGYGAMTEVFQ